MKEEPEQDPGLQQLKDAVRQTVTSGRDLQSHVSDLVFSALSTATAQIDQEHLRRVTRTALEGIGAGARSHGTGSAEVIRKSVAGVEEALLKTAGVSRLAIDEAAGHVEEFAKTDLRHAVDELASLQELFLGILGDVAMAGSNTAAATFTDIQRHIRDSGGALGTLLTDNARDLQELFPPVVREGLQEGMASAGKAAEQLGRMAGGVIEGIARGLEESGRRSSGNTDVDNPGDG